MGVVADAVLAAGGEVIGVIPHALMAREIGHAGVTSMHVVDSMHERKALMADQADAFVALPGGVGTFEELFEAITWTQLGVHAKPCGLLNVDGFYDDLLRFLDHAWTEGFIKPETRAIVKASADPHELLDQLGRRRCRTCRAGSRAPPVEGRGQAARDERQVGAQLEGEAAAGPRHEPDVGALLVEPPAQQEQPPLEVVLELRQLQRLVEAQLAVGELGAALALAAPTAASTGCAPAGSRIRYSPSTSTQSSACVEGDLAPRPRAPSPAAAAPPAPPQRPASSASSALLQHARSESPIARYEPSSSIEARSSSWKRYGVSLSSTSTPTSSPRTTSGTPSWLAGLARPGQRDAQLLGTQAVRLGPAPRRVGIAASRASGPRSGSACALRRPCR